MAPQQPYTYNYSPNQTPPPSYNYQGQQPYYQPPYQQPQYQQPQYQQPQYQQPSVTQHRTSPRANCAILTAQQFALIVPGVILILNIWWSVTARVCPNNASADDTCFRMLWYSLPIATIAFIWGIASNISARRRHRHMTHIPQTVNALVLLILALGATTCFALMVHHMQRYDIWSRSSEAAMAALLAIMLIIHWTLFGWTAVDLIKERRAAQHSSNHVPI